MSITVLDPNEGGKNNSEIFSELLFLIRWILSQTMPSSPGLLLQTRKYLMILKRNISCLPVVVQVSLCSKYCIYFNACIIAVILKVKSKSDDQDSSGFIFHFLYFF